MKLFPLFVILFSLFSLQALFTAAQIQLNEVMYNPDECSDTQCEWVELYNTADEAINTSECFLDGRNFAIIIPAHAYLILARNTDSFSQYFGNFSPVLQFSLSLGNSGDSLNLSGNENCSEFFNYTSLVGLADGNNRTLEKRADGTWDESAVENGTPGQPNSLLNFSTNYLPLVISEVFPNSVGNDNMNKPFGEWVEIYNLGEDVIDMGRFVLKDQDDDHELIISDSNILDEDGLFLYPGDYIVVYREVRLFAGTELVDEMSYTGSTEGMSWSNVEGDWYITIPTPYEDNILDENCDWFLALDLNNSIYQNRNLSFEVAVQRYFGFDQYITVRGEIEDVNGEVVRTYAPWTNVSITTLATKSYNPNLPSGIYQLHFWIGDLACNDQDASDNEITRLIALNPEYQRSSSSLTIEQLSIGRDGKVSFGEQFQARVNIYKGNATTDVIQLWVEKDGKKVSEVTKVYLYDPYQEYPLNVPLQLIPNCDEEIEDGTATVVMEGLGMRTEHEVTLRGVDEDICTDYLDYAQAQKRPAQHTLLGYPSVLEVGATLPLQLQIVNDEVAHEYEVWGYIYRGGKCYSCKDSTLEKEANLQRFSMGPLETKTVEVLLPSDGGLEVGEYKIKVLLHKDAQRTNKEFTGTIQIRATRGLQQNGTLATFAVEGLEEEKIPPFSKRPFDTGTGMVVYESNSARSQKVVPYLLLTTLGLIGFIVLRKN